MTEGHRGGRDQLQPLEGLGVLVGTGGLADGADQVHREEGDEEGDERRDHDRDRGLLHARPGDGVHAACGEAGADEATDERGPDDEGMPTHQVA